MYGESLVFSLLSVSLDLVERTALYICAVFTSTTAHLTWCKQSFKDMNALSGGSGCGASKRLNSTASEYVITLINCF